MPITMKDNIESIRDKILATLPTLNITLHDPKHSSFQQITNSFLELSTDQKQTIYKTLFKVLLLIGNQESPKTLFCQNLLAELWRNYKEGCPIPLWISLPQLKKPFTRAIEETLENYGFTLDQIAELKKEHSFIFIVDGYEQLKQLQNVYVTNHFNLWCAKTIITCSSEWASQFTDPFRYFMPFHGEQRQPQQLQIFTLTSFESRSTFAPLPVRQLTESKEPVKTKQIMRDEKSLDKKDIDSKQSVVVALPDDTLFHHLLTKDQEKINFFADRVTESAVYKNYLFYLIEQSKTDERYAIAAANAITALNRAHVSFSAKDFRNIRIPGADVSYGIFDHTQLQGADLRKSNLEYVWMRNADISDAKIDDTQFGRLPIKIPLSRTDSQHRYRGNKVLIKYSPDGRWLAVVANDDIYIYQAKNDDFYCIFKNSESSESYVTDMSFSYDGKYLATISKNNNGKIQVWQLDGKKLDQIIQTAAENVLCLSFHPDNQQLACSYDNRTIYIWDIKEKKIGADFKLDIEPDDASLELNQGPATCIAFSPNGQYLAAGVNNMLYLWSKNKAKYKEAIFKFDSVIKTICFNSNSKYIAMATSFNKVQLFYIESKTSIAITSLEDRISMTVFSTTDELLVTAGIYHIDLWQLQPQKTVLCSFNFSHIDSLAFDSSGQYLAIGSYHQNNATVQFWRLGRKNLSHNSGYIGSISSIALSENGRYLALNSRAGVIRLFEIKKDGLEYIYQNRKYNIDVSNPYTGGFPIVFSPNSQYLAMSFGRTIYLIRLTQKYSEHILKPQQCQSLAFSSDNQFIVSGDSDGGCYIWRIGKSDPIYIFYGHTASIYHLAFSSNNQYLISVANGEAHLRKLFYKKIEYIFKAASNLASFTPDSQHLALVENNHHNIGLWRITTKKLEHTFAGHSEDITCFAFSPDGEYLASADMECTVRIWSVQDKLCLTILDNFTNYIRNIVWSKSSESLFFATNAVDSIQLWQVYQQNKTINVILFWSSAHHALITSNIKYNRITGLDSINSSIFKTQDDIKHSSLHSTSSSRVDLKLEQDIAINKISWINFKLLYENRKINYRSYVALINYHYEQCNIFETIYYSSIILKRLFKEEREKQSLDSLELSELLNFVTNNLGCYYHCYSNSQSKPDYVDSELLKLLKLDDKTKMLSAAEHYFKLKLEPTTILSIDYVQFLLRQNRIAEAINQLEMRLNDSEITLEQEENMGELNYQPMERSTLDDTLKIELDYWGNFSIKEITMGYYLLVTAYIQLNQIILAQNIVEKFHKIVVAETDPLSFSLLGHTQQLVNDHAGAVEGYRQALRLKPDYTVAQQRLKQSSAICISGLADSLQRLGIFKSLADMKTANEKSVESNIVALVNSFLFSM